MIVVLSLVGFAAGATLVVAGVVKGNNDLVTTGASLFTLILGYWLAQYAEVAQECARWRRA